MYALLSVQVPLIREALSVWRQATAPPMAQLVVPLPWPVLTALHLPLVSGPPLEVVLSHLQVGLEAKQAVPLTLDQRITTAVLAAPCRSRAALRLAAALVLCRSRRVRRVAVRAALFRFRLVRVTLARAVLPRLRRAARRLAMPWVVTCRSRPAAAAVAAAACAYQAVLVRPAQAVACR